MKDEEQKTAMVEYEGGGWHWWYVCGECHGTISQSDEVCPHCKCKLLWEGVLLK